jgi:hypothetical protein
MRTIGDDGDDKAEASASANDGGVLLAGRRSDKESGYKNVYIVKTDGQGGALCNQASVALDDLKHAAVQTVTTPFSPAVAIGAKRHPCSTLTQKIVDPNANTTIPCRSSVCL